MKNPPRKYTTTFAGDFFLRLFFVKVVYYLAISLIHFIQAVFNVDSRYRAACRSYTKGKVYELSVSSRYLAPNDRVLILDDFLAEGNALNALLSLCEQAGASVVGCGVIIEKAYQSGGALIRSRGIRVESLARIASMSEDGALTFCE